MVRYISTWLGYILLWVVFGVGVLGGLVCGCGLVCVASILPVERRGWGVGVLVPEWGLCGLERLLGGSDGIVAGGGMFFGGLVGGQLGAVLARVTSYY